MLLDRKQGGFLLVETLLAAVIIVVALVAGMGVFITSQRVLSISAGHTGAVYLAQKQAEMLKATMTTVQWNNMYPDLVKFKQSIKWQDASETLPINLNNFKYTVDTVADVCTDSSAQVEVTITVTWKERGSDQKYTLVAQYPRF